MTIRDNKVSELYRELEPNEPSHALDQAIIAAARREVTGKSSNNLRQLSRWAVPLSAAAMLVIGVSTLMMIQEREPQTFRPPPENETVPLIVTPSTTAKEKPVQDPSQSTSGAPAPFLSENPTPTPENAKRFEQERRKQENIRRELEVDVYREIKSREAERRSDLEHLRTEETRKLREDEPLIKQEDSFTKDGSVNSFAPPETPTPELATGATATPPQTGIDTRIMGDSGGVKTPPPSTPAAVSKPAAETWLKKIAHLKRDGKTQEAATELIAFKHVYPNFPASRSEELLKQFENEAK